MASDYEDRTMAVGASALTAAPTSPMNQVYWSVKKAVEEVTAAGERADKLVLGISCKNVAWKVTSTTDLTLAAAAPFYVSNDTLHQRLSQSGTIHGWSDAYQCPYAVYTTEDGSTYFVWYDDAESVQARADMAALMGLGGMSVWRLGSIPAYDGWSWTDALN